MDVGALLNHDDLSSNESEVEFSGGVSLPAVLPGPDNTRSRSDTEMENTRSMGSSDHGSEESDLNSVWNTWPQIHPDIMPDHSQARSFSWATPSPSSISSSLPPIVQHDPTDAIYEGEFAGVSDYENSSDVLRFLDNWQYHGGHKVRGISCLGSLEDIKRSRRPKSITRQQVKGDGIDIQGISWNSMETSREEARRIRNRLCAGRGSHHYRSRDATKLPDNENFFRFKRTNTEHRAAISHWQLRNTVAATSRDDIFYTGKSKVMRTDALGHTSSSVMDFTTTETQAPPCAINTLDAKYDVLVAGGHYGDYAILDLTSEYGTDPTHGFVSSFATGHTNHVHLCPNRTSGLPQAVFSSNDGRLRILDTTTNKFFHDTDYGHAINCSATSPNGRLRVIVGDSPDILITDAETGQSLKTLEPHDPSSHNTHSSDGFACAWADDDVHVATGGQDSTIVVYDARNWSRPLAKIATEFRHPRSLRFSPIGGGKRVLVAAEDDDFVSLIDARSFEAKQTIGFFGAVAGVAFTPDGSSLFVMNADRVFGGLMEFERTGYSATHGGSQAVWRRDWRGEREETNDWMPEYDMLSHPNVVLSAKARRRRGIDLDGIFV